MKAKEKAAFLDARCDFMAGRFSERERILPWQDGSEDKAIQLFVMSLPAIGSTPQVPNILPAVHLGTSHSSGMSLLLPDHRWESLQHTLFITSNDKRGRGRRQLPLLQIKPSVKAEFPPVRWSRLEHNWYKLSPISAPDCHSPPARPFPAALAHTQMQWLQQNPLLPWCSWTERKPHCHCHLLQLLWIYCTRKDKAIPLFDTALSAQTSLSLPGCLSADTEIFLEEQLTDWCTKIVYLLTVSGMQH